MFRNVLTNNKCLSFIKYIIKTVNTFIIAMPIRNLGAQFQFDSCCLVLESSLTLRQLVPSFLQCRSSPTEQLHFAFLGKDFGSPKKILFQNILNPTKFWVQENFGSKKILGLKNCWVRKIQGQKLFFYLKFSSCKNLRLFTKSEIKKTIIEGDMTSIPDCHN